MAPKDHVHPRLDKQRLGQLIDLVGNIGLGDKTNRTKDILGRVYEYSFRDALLPKLISDELCVPDAGRIAWR